MKHAFDRFIHYLQKNYFSYWIVLGIDTFIALVCTWVSFIGIHYITETSKEITSLFHILAISVISSILGSFLFHTYRNTTDAAICLDLIFQLISERYDTLLISFTSNLDLHCLRINILIEQADKFGPPHSRHI